MAKFVIEKHDMGRGIWQMTAYEPNWPAPIGIAWVLGFSGPKKDGAVLFDCYTSVGYRRQGVMTQIVGAILRDYEYVSSDGVSKDGTAFMRKTGFKYRRESGDWIRTRGKTT